MDSRQDADKLDSHLALSPENREKSDIRGSRRGITIRTEMGMSIDNTECCGRGRGRGCKWDCCRHVMRQMK